MVFLDQNWLELKDIRSLTYDEQVWIPIYGFKYGDTHAKFPEIGHYEEFQQFGGAVIFDKYKTIAEKITSWDTWSKDEYSPYYSDEYPYEESHQFSDSEENPIGFRLAISQFLSNDVPTQMHLYQDFVIAYHLIFEEGSWIRPKNDNEKVVRYLFDENKEIRLVEVKASYLKDYLAVRGASYRLYYYTGRQLIQKDKPKFDWDEEKIISEFPNDRCSARIEFVTKHGDPPRTGSILVESHRTDVNFREDIPNFSEKGFSGISSTSRTTVDTNLPDRYFAYCRMWRGEWISKADRTRLIGNLKHVEDLFVFTTNTSEPTNLKTLRSEEVGQYLWFKPDVIGQLATNRDGRIRWGGRNLGTFHYSIDSKVDFGVNSLGLINVYACDIANLRQWEKTIWVSQNCPPEGGVCEELLEFQQECKQPTTKSPERNLVVTIHELNRWFIRKFDRPLLLRRDEMFNIIQNIHRFRSVNEQGLQALARDIFKYVFEWVSPSNLKDALKTDLPSGKTLKMLEQLLREHSNIKDASKVMEAIFGLHDLRNHVSHLASSEANIEKYYGKIGINRDQPYVNQGAEMIERVSETLANFIDSG